nr:hypothetical protein [Tanacetum cinerariifolium]
RIVETIHVDFDELAAMSSEQHSLGPALNEMTPETISSGLVPTTSPSTSYLPPSRNDWDLLFQPMFDELLNPPPTPEAIAPIVEVIPSINDDSTGSPSSKTIKQDAPSTTHMGNDPLFGVPIPDVTSAQSTTLASPQAIVHINHPMPHHNSKWTKDHPLNNIIGQLSTPVSTRLQLHEQALFCYYDAFLTSVEPKTYKEALTQSCWIKAMHEELNEFERLEVWELVPRPDQMMVITLKWIYKARPTEKNVHTVKKIFRYLRGTVHRRLWYPKDSSIAVTAFADADHAGCQDTRRSTSRSVQFLGERLISWSSKRQKSTAISSTEAEYIALSGCCAKSYGCDHSFQIMALHLKKFQCTATIKVILPYAAIMSNTLEYQLADLFTKALGGDRIEFLTNKQGMKSFTPETLKKLMNEEDETMETTIEQQVTLDEALVPSAQRLRIGRSNFRLPSDIQSKESTLQVVNDVLRRSPFFKAFLVTADVPEIYMQEFWATATVHQHSIRFKMDTKKHIVDLEAFREMLHISPRVSGQSFAELPFKEEILEFLRFLGHSAQIKTLTDVNVNKLYQPWRSFAAVINKCLTGKSSGFDSLRLSQAQILWGLYHKRNVDYAFLIWEDLVYQVEHKNQKKSNEMNTKAYKEYYACATVEAAPKPKASARKKKGGSALSTTPPTSIATPTPTTTVVAAPKLSAAAKDKGTGSKPGVPDVPSDDSDEEISWNSSDDEDVDAQGKDRDDDEANKNDESDDRQDDDDDDQDEAEKVNDDDDDEEEISKIDEQEA